MGRLDFPKAQTKLIRPTFIKNVATDSESIKYFFVTIGNDMPSSASICSTWKEC